jgi:hypothetical protein
MALLWRAFILGRLPELLSDFGAIVRLREALSERDWVGHLSLHQSNAYFASPVASIRSDGLGRCIPAI